MHLLPCIKNTENYNRNFSHSFAQKRVYMSGGIASIY